MTIKYVVREGYERGKGRYLGMNDGWTDRCAAYEFHHKPAAEDDAKTYGGRVIRLVPRKPRVTRERVEAAAVVVAKNSGLAWSGLSDFSKSSWRAAVVYVLQLAGVEVES